MPTYESTTWTPDLGNLAPYGVGHLDTPLTPEKIWRAMQD